MFKRKKKISQISPKLKTNKTDDSCHSFQFLDKNRHLLNQIESINSTYKLPPFGNAENNPRYLNLLKQIRKKR